MIKLADIDPKHLEAARRKREEHVKSAQLVFDTCACAWPIVTYRNGTGHHPECPRHLAIIDKPKDPRFLDG